MKDKKQTKRVTLKKKYNVEKKVRGHNKKMKKLVRAGTTNKRYKRKDPGIPNLFPFKAHMLEQIRVQREKALLEKEHKKEEEREKQRRMRIGQGGLGDDDDMNTAESESPNADYAEIRRQAEEATAQFVDSAHPVVSGKPMGTEANGTTGFYRSLRQVIDKSDVLMEVLDVRDPLGCRHLSIERQIIADGKKLVLLLNKIDLVPKEVVELWVAYLRNSFPVVAFKSALTTKASRPITHAAAPAHIMSETELHVGAQVVGAPALIQLLKNYSRTAPTSAKLAITVGIIGVPNVGKSSVINSLCRSANSAKVGGEAGITRRLQEIHLDAKIKLIDSPGVILGETERMMDSDSVLRGAVKISAVKNPIEVVETMLQKFPADQIMKLYKVPLYSTTSEFLGHVARVRGKLVKGGALDFMAAAQLVLTEWVSGKVRHFCLPPTVHRVDLDALDAGLISGPRFVSKFSDPFDIDALLRP